RRQPQAQGRRVGDDLPVAARPGHDRRRDPRGPRGWAVAVLAVQLALQLALQRSDPDRDRDPMTTFFLDLWQDLRQKRLWPLAVALLAATVAVPVVLAKSPSSPPASLASADGAGKDKLPAVTLDASSISGSHLDVFGTKNPFASGADPTPGTTTPGTPGSPLGDSVAKAVSKAGDSTTGGGGASP